jgi:hypothetical protein
MKWYIWQRISPSRIKLCLMRQIISFWMFQHAVLQYTWRSQIQVLPPLLRDKQRPPGYPKQASPAVFDSEHLLEVFNGPVTYRFEKTSWASFIINKQNRRATSSFILWAHRASNPGPLLCDSKVSLSNTSNTSILCVHVAISAFSGV